MLQPSGWGQGEAELPFGSFGLEEGPGQSPPWAKAKVEAGLTGFRALRRWPERPPGKGNKTEGPGPIGTVQHTNLQNQLLSISVLSSGVHHR